MSDRYKGAILSPTSPTVIPQSAGGVYTLSQQLQYQGQGVWPPAISYPVNNSLRFRSSASAYLNRTFSTGNRLLFTFSAWVKRGSLTGNQNIFGPYTNSTGTGTYGVLRFVGGTLEAFDYTNGTINWYLVTTQVFRDPSAWYHIVIAYDSAQATSSNRVKLYVNGVQVTAFSYAAYPSLSYQGQWNDGLVNYIGTTPVASQYFDGYLTEVNFIGGQALTPSSFGTTDAYGIWQPIPYTGTYGTNGFYLPFTDNSALTTSSNVGLGKDFSGNGNYFVTNNISITAGSTYDSMKDVPTNTNSNTANYCVLNPLDNAGGGTVSDGNLKLVSSGSTWRIQPATMAVSRGKYYFEAVQTGYAGTNVFACGLVPVPTPSLDYLNLPSSVSGSSGWSFQLDSASTLYFWYAYSGSAQYITISTSFNIGDVAQIAFDLDAGTIWVGKNNTWYNSTGGTTGNPAAGTNPTATNLSGQVTPFLGAYGSTAYGAINFGQRPFSYTPPSGFYPLNTYNLPTPTILDGDQYFNAVLYSGNSSTQNIAVGFQPDFVWSKCRNVGRSHRLIDSVRGLSYQLFSDSTAGGSTYDATSYASSITSTSSSGFAVTNAGSDQYNTSGENYVSWAWRASNAAGVSNTQGTITSTVSANTTAGFSIVTYTGNATSGATVGHGLGVAPSMVIVKSRNNGTTNWCVYHISVGNQYATLLNTTAAPYSNSNYWNNTSPTSTLFSLGNGTDTNQSTGTYVAYCFAQVAGYSAFGSYTGNGSTDGPFIYTGFRPRFVLWKNITQASQWILLDTACNTYNVANAYLEPNTFDTENTANTVFDMLSNGFKLRNGGGTDYNENANTYIYMAFAENPFKIARAR